MARITITIKATYTVQVDEQEAHQKALASTDPNMSTVKMAQYIAEAEAHRALDGKVGYLLGLSSYSPA